MDFNNPVFLEWFLRLIGVGALALMVAVGWLGLVGFRRYERSAQAALDEIFEGLKIHNGPAPGLVEVVFHTYHGLFVWFTQTKHHFWAPPDDAKVALWRLYRFSLRRGFFAAGGLYVGPLSFAHYLLQKRSIRKQEEAASLTWPGDKFEEWPEDLR